MASDADDFDKTIENVKTTVRSSFARMYASLKARELKTLRQLEAIRKHCQDDKALMRSCARDLYLNFDNETKLLDDIYKFGAIDLEKLKFDSNTFTLEDYVSPENDHMYSHKTIEDLAKEEVENLAIEEAALKQVTATDNCVCYVNIRTEDVSKQFKDSSQNSPVKLSSELVNSCSACPEPNEEELERSLSSESDVEIKKIEPTDEWLNSIKSQTETEPSQVTDVMEHSTITCS